MRRVRSLWSRVRRLLVPLGTSRGRDVCASGTRLRAKNTQRVDQRADRVAEEKPRKIWWWGTSRLQQLSLVLGARGVVWNFAAKPWKEATSLVSEDVSPFQHIVLAKNAQHPTLAHVALDDTAVFAIEFRESLGFDLVRWRRIILDEVSEIRTELETETNQWLAELPAHGKIVYLNRACPNVPLLRHLGQLINYPNIEHLMEDISSGFTSSVNSVKVSVGKRTRSGLRSRLSTRQRSFVSTMSTSCTRSTLGDPMSRCLKC